MVLLYVLLEEGKLTMPHVQDYIITMFYKRISAMQISTSGPNDSLEMDEIIRMANDLIFACLQVGARAFGDIETSVSRYALQPR